MFVTVREINTAELVNPDGYGFFKSVQLPV